MVQANSPYAAGIASEEASNTIHQSPPWIWVDNTSRDEVVGAFFGLGAAFDLVDDATVKSGISNLATLMLGFVARTSMVAQRRYLEYLFVAAGGVACCWQVQHHVDPSHSIGGPAGGLPDRRGGFRRRAEQSTHTSSSTWTT